MAYKRNPMRSERIGSALARYVIVDALKSGNHCMQHNGLKEHLDDSANKRISVPEAFLAVDAILSLYINVVDGLVVYDKVINQQFMREIPFMATENIMMDAVKKGGDRQDLHEKIRVYSMEAGKTVKMEGKENNLAELIAGDPAFGLTLEEINAVMKPENFVGRAPQQVEDFLKDYVEPVLEKNKDLLGIEVEINV